MALQVLLVGSPLFGRGDSVRLEIKQSEVALIVACDSPLGTIPAARRISSRANVSPSVTLALPALRFSAILLSTSFAIISLFTLPSNGLLLNLRSPSTRRRARVPSPGMSQDVVIFLLAALLPRQLSSTGPVMPLCLHTIVLKKPGSVDNAKLGYWTSALLKRWVSCDSGCVLSIPCSSQR